MSRAGRVDMEEVTLCGKDPSSSNICVKDKDNVKIIVKFFLKGDYKSIKIYYLPSHFGPLKYLFNFIIFAFPFENIKSFFQGSPL